MKNLDGRAQSEASRLDDYRRIVERLPITLRPSINQQLSRWEMLFPFEQNQVATFMKGVESFSPSALEALTAPLYALEVKMGVKRWGFSQSSDTIENASQLARSEYYAAWRSEVQRIYETVNAATRRSTSTQAVPGRLILLILPSSLPVDPLTAWRQWDPRGYEVKISGDAEELCELAIEGRPRGEGVAELMAKRENVESADLWLIDAEAKLGGHLHTLAGSVSSLSFAALKVFRDSFLAALNKAPKNIRITDEIVASLRHASWDGLWPAELAGQPRLREFVIDLFLSGNGALIFASPFVEWAASEALRRARPRLIVARFGMRSKPKPFTSIAVFENQQKISSLPDVDDPENSAIDALILARYIWLAACRYPEGAQTACVCVSEHGKSAYVVPHAGKGEGWKPDRAVTSEELYRWVGAQLIS